MGLPWISDEILTQAVNYLLEKAESATKASVSEFGKNVIDPFGALFEMTGFKMSYEEWYQNETIRQAQKTLQNHIGSFHQKVLGSVATWKDLEVGQVADLLCTKKKIIAEVKNKYNTVSGGRLADVYKNLANLVEPKHSGFKGYCAYYVVIIPKTKVRFNTIFRPSDKETGKQCPPNENIRIIDGASFYSLVTGRHNALSELFDYLPKIIENCSSVKISKAHEKILKQHFEKAFA